MAELEKVDILPNYRNAAENRHLLEMHFKRKLLGESDTTFCVLYATALADLLECITRRHGKKCDAWLVVIFLLVSL